MRLSTRALAAVAAVLTCLAAGAGAAQAAVVSTVRSETPAMDFSNPKTGPDMRPATTRYVLSIAAGAGESNALTVEHVMGAMIVRDVVALTPGAGCEPADGTTVRCPMPAGAGSAIVEQIMGDVTLGDGDDSFRAPPRAPFGGFEQSKVDGGDGNDVIVSSGSATGGPGDDRLIASYGDGGPGDDHIAASGGDGGEGHDVLVAGPSTPGGEVYNVELRGGPGNDALTGSSFARRFGKGDVLDGGDGDDRLTAQDGHDVLLPGPGADVIDGGAGNDHVSFAYATAPVRADLATPAATDPTGEGDAMAGVESVEGGAGDDVLLGGDGDNLLVGGAGSDQILGRGGPDVIVGGTGADTIDGGDGADDLASGDGDVDLERRDYGGPGAFGQHTTDAAPDRLAGGDGMDTLRIGTGDRGDAGPGDDLLVAEGRPAAVSCAGGKRDRFDGDVRVPRNCERVIVWVTDSMPAQLRLHRGVVAVRVPGHYGNRVAVVLRVGGRVLARAGTTIPFDEHRTLRLRIAPRARRALLRARSVRLNLISTDDGRPARDTVLLPAPRS